MDEEYKWLKDHRESQRQIIQDHLNSVDKILSIAEAIQFFRKEQSEYILHGIISADIVQMLDYRPVRLVSQVREASAADKEFLNRYWEKHYEFDLSDYRGGFEYIVVLLFWSESEYYGDGWVGYDYPSNIIDIFTLSKKM